MPFRQLARNLILEFILVEDSEQLFSAHLPWVTSYRPQHPQQLSALDILFRRDVLQIVCTPVEHISIDVVNFVALRPWTNPCECHEHVACPVPELPHEGVARVTHSRISGHGEAWLDLP